MTDVEDPYAIREDPIKELVGIANEGNDTHAEPLLDAWRGLRVLGDMHDNFADSGFDGSGDLIAVSLAGRGDLS
jgi:hypothetical protein